MTARGKNVKTQTLATEVWRLGPFCHPCVPQLNSIQNEIFVYDRQYVSDPDNIELPEIPPPQPFTPDNPPDTLADQNDLQAWRGLYMARRSWALNLSERCGFIDRGIREHNERTDIINRAAGVALENLKSHVGNLEHRFQEAQDWANDLLKEQQAALDGWQRALGALDSIPARKDFTFLGRPSTPKKGKNQSAGTLRDYVDVAEVERAGTEATGVSRRFGRHVEDIEKAVDEIASDTQRLTDDDFPASVEGVDSLLQEVETIAKKISSDYEHVLSLPNNQKTLANISRLALNHTKDLLPSLSDITSELQGALEEGVRRHNAAMKAALNHMRIISSVESRLAGIQSQIINLDVQSDAFDILFSAFHMPMVYGSVLIESVRRREWSNKMKADSLALAEEMAVFRDEEQRRRKKWLKSMGDFISIPDSQTPGLEVNLQGQEYELPEVNRKEIESYIDELRTKPEMGSTVEELAQLYKDLDAPTRQQRRRAKAFKQGSVVDMGKSSMLLHGDDMVRSLRDEKLKLEERLKGSESRIRKLEDLVHRQSQLGRPPSGNFGPEFPSSPVSHNPDQLSRRSSTSSRRMSSNQSSDDKALVQRVVSLEAELASEREVIHKLHKEAHVERQSNTDKMQEAQSTKKDLIGNLESRQREFEDERKFLEGEVKKFKIRAEELEEELDNKDQERHDIDDRLHGLEAELQSANANTEEEARRANGLDEQMQALKESKGALQSRIDGLEKLKTEQEKKDRENYNALQVAFMNLSPGGAVPPEIPGITKAIEVLSEGLSIHARSADESAARAIAESKSLEERLGQLEVEAEGLRNHSGARETELSQMNDELSQAKSKFAGVTSELDEERSKLNALQSQLDNGATGPDALQERLTEEGKFARLSERLAEVESQARWSEDEISTWKKRVETMSESEQKAASQVESRRVRSQELSKQLFEQVEKLGRMLEQLGFTIIRQDGNIVVQRASKVNSSSGLGDSLGQSGVVSVRPDAELLNWTHASNDEDEKAQFTKFIECLSQFDVNVFGDAVVKRVKDVELLARKWQKEARGYRDKYHRTQGDAHDKIAYRSFKEGDLALFLPTRNQAIRSWAAFNVGAPHYFLREQDSHKLQTRDWLLARITKIEERVVDLSKSMNGPNPDRRSIGETSDAVSFDDENPFELSDGLRWYLLDATEEKPGAPATPGLGTSTVAPAHVDAKGSIRLKRTLNEGNVARTLTKSLDSRRDSSNSKKGAPAPAQLAHESTGELVRPAEADTASQPREAAPVFEEVRRDLLQRP